MQLKFLGTGTSQGVPVIGCPCKVCASNDKKDHRFRSSVLITNDDGKKILVDCGPDFRQQMLQNKESHVDAVLLTHEHNDHVIGLDDLRPIIFKNQKDMDIFALKRVCDEIKNRFPYAFSANKYPGAPSFENHEIDGSFNIFNMEIMPINVLHHQLEIIGFKVKNMAYVTDASSISELEKEKLKNLDILVLNCLRKENSHPAHFILPDVVQLYNELVPKKMYLTHISHHFGLYEVEETLLPQNIHLAWDGLVLDF